MVQADYTQFMKPLTGRLLRFLQLDKVYADGEGNRLLYRDEQGTVRAVLDLTGGYGANLLGHKNPELISAVPSLMAELPPSHVQGSIGEWSARLARELSDRLTAETGMGPWVCTLANSGAEAVEAALKHALLAHRGWVKKKSFILNTQFNTLRKHLENLAPEGQGALLDRIRQVCREGVLPEGLFFKLDRIADLDHAVDLLEQHNREVLFAAPHLLAVEGGFHGKTLGALSVTGNPLFRDDFFLDDRNTRTLLIRRNDPKDIARALDSATPLLVVPRFKNGAPHFQTKEINKAAACILEPIQGEGGIHPLEEGFVRSLREEADRRGFLLIFDEIQAGLYRTGMLSSGARLGVCADLYCFSKALGGGVAKIAAMLARKDRYVERFGFLHTSTYAEDPFSSAIACRVLGLLNPAAVGEGMSTAELLKRGLQELQQRYPSVIREVRGQGFLLGIEFRSEIRQSCYEFKFFCDLGMIGYLFSSALLQHEDLRVNPTLSSPLTLRIETSLFTTGEEVHQVCCGLARLCDAISSLDMTYFFGHIFRGCRIGPAHRIPEGVIGYDKGSRPAAVFLSHVIQTEDMKEIFHAFKEVDAGVLEGHLRDMFELLEFQVYFRGLLRGRNGRETDAVVLALPAPSGLVREVYKSERTHLLWDKIQNGLDHARELGARTIGLGQFTSIATRNGLCLDGAGLNLTTGNAYTVALMIEATLRTAAERRIDMKEAHIGFVGAAGNIVSVSASILAGHCRKVSFFYHTPVEKSKKLVQVLSAFLRETASAHPPGAGCAGRISQCLQGRSLRGREDLLGFLGRKDVKDLLALETDLSRLRRCDIVLTGTNGAGPLIEPSFLKEGAVVVDAGVPGDVPAGLREVRPDVMVIQGGIARIPQVEGGGQSIFLPSFPLKKGQAFGCMSETFSIGLANGRRIYHVGPLTREVVERARSIAEEAGFELCEYKEVKTFDF
jgi:acetylornithine/succinyldiaminopimelate/putrescine aminotransferase/predicted amino acid dehydrogenase